MDAVRQHFSVKQPHPKVVAFVPQNGTREGGNFGLLLVVENPDSSVMERVVAIAGKGDWMESERIGTVPAGEGRRASFNLALGAGGEWTIPIWVGEDKTDAIGWKGVLTTGVREKVAAKEQVTNVTVVGQQNSGEKSAMGAVIGDISVNLQGLESVLQKGEQEQVAKGLLVPVEVSLERRDAITWQQELDTMNPKPPEPAAPAPQSVNVTVENRIESSPAGSSPSSATDDIARGTTMILGVVVLLAFLGLGGLVYFLLTQDREAPEPVLSPESLTGDAASVVKLEQAESESVALPPPKREQKVKPFQRVEASVVGLALDEGEGLVMRAVEALDGRVILSFGKEYAMKVKLKTAGYLRIFGTRKDGRLWQVYPNSLHASERFEAGDYIFPDPSKIDQDGFITIEAKDRTPLGRTERFLVQWSQDPFEEGLFGYEGEAFFPVAVRGTGIGRLRVQKSEEQEIEYRVK